MANCLYVASTGDILEKTERNYTVFDFYSDWANVITYKRGGWYYRDVGGTKSTFYNVYKNATISSNSGGSGASTLQQGAFFTGSAQKTGANPGTVSISRTSVVSGFPVTVTASCANQYRAVWWDASTGGTSKTVTPTANYSYNVSFEQYKWLLKAKVSSAGGGTISLNGWTSGLYYETGTKKATATAKDGYRFLGWFVGEEQYYGPDKNNVEVDIILYAADTTWEARFTSTSHALTVTAGVGGSLHSDSDTSGTRVEDILVKLQAAPDWNYTFNQWLCIGKNNSYDNPHAFYMPWVDVTAQASFTIRPSFSINVTSENGSLGSIVLSSIGGSVESDAGSINSTGYTNIEFTLTASVIDNVHNMFVGWYSGGIIKSGDDSYVFTQTDTANVALVAKFAQRPAYTIEKRISDGDTTHGPGNPAYDAGCSIAVDSTPDFSDPDKWLAKNIFVTATPATGWHGSGWNISDKDLNGSSVSINSGVNPMQFTLSYNSIVTGYFTLIPLVVSVVIDAPAALVDAGTVEISAGDKTGDELDLRYNDTVAFEATPAGGYAFAGWYHAGSGEPVAPSTVAGIIYLYTDELYVVEHITDNMSLVAKFSAPVTVTASHTPNTDTNYPGTVQLNSGAAGVSASINVVIGENCVIVANSTEGSIFNSWHLASDSLFESPIEGYSATYIIQVNDITSLFAHFVGELDLETRYLAVRNYNNNTAMEDPLLGIIIASGGTEITQAEWETFVNGAVPSGTVADAGNKYYKFTGSVSTTVKAVSNGGLGFMQWQTQYLIPAETGFTLSSPMVRGKLPITSIVTNKHYVLTAVWGDPVAVKLTLKYADGCNSTNGGFTMSPVTSERMTVHSGISDKYLQGVGVTLAAYIENGYLFDGWYYGSTGTALISTNPTLTHFVEAPVEIFARFIPDTNAVYTWEGGIVNKMIEWISRRYVASKPFNPSAAKVYADTYPVELSIYMCSSPDSPSGTEPTIVSATDQDGFRLPMERPEKYIEIGIKATAVVQNATVSTSMGGLIQ